MDDHTDPIHFVKLANESLKNKVDRAIENFNQPNKAMGSYILENEETLDFFLIRGTWVDFSPDFPGLRQMLIDTEHHCGNCPAKWCSSMCSRVLVEAREKITLPKHYHKNSETVHIIEGEYTDRLSDLPFYLRRPLDKIYYPAGKFHQPEMKGLFMICWSPPLFEIK